MFNLIRSGKMTFASATALSLSPEAAHEFNRDIEPTASKIVLRPQEISNHPEVDPPPRHHRHERADRGRHLRQRQFDPYPRLSIMNGIGGSGDFARNAYLSIFMTPSSREERRRFPASCRW